jgi:hypothetical protein
MSVEAARAFTYPASLRIHFSQHLAAEEIVQATDPVRKLRYVGLRGASFGISRLAMSVINCEHIRDIDVFNIEDATRGLVLRGDILYEASSAAFGGFRSTSPAKIPVAISRSPSRMVQTGFATRRPFFLLAFRLESLGRLLIRGIAPSCARYVPAS